MTPVAMSHRAALLPALFCSALLLSITAGASQLSSAEVAADAANAGLKPGSRYQLADGIFKYDTRPDGDSGVAADELPDTPGATGSDYSLRGSMSSGGGLALERGVASWYGKMFHGRKTAGGDPYDMYAMTAAHPSLPIPSYVRVTNLSNGRSAVVRVNDRGPFHPGRIIDLSYAAAYKLGYVDKGQANVEVALVLPEEVAMVRSGRSVPPIRRAKAAQPRVTAVAARAVAPAPVASVEPAQAPVESAAPVLAAVSPATARPADRVTEKVGDEVFLQLGSFGSAVGAEQFKNLVEYELKWLKESVSVLVSGGKYRLRVGPFTSDFEARSIAERIADTLKLKSFVVQR